jgi:hypothetical protein
MNTQAIFGLSALSSLVASSVAAALWVMPKVRTMQRSEALLLLVAPHMFFRTIGLSFLVPGVVSPELPEAFAAPAAYGDFGAAILAIASILSLATRLPWSIPLVWVFNVWGAADLINAIYQGNMRAIDPGMLGAAFYIPTAVVPPLLVTHALIFLVLVRPTRPT